MKVGLFLNNEHERNTDMVEALDEAIMMVREARDREWDSVFCGQHYLTGGARQQLQPVPFLARLIPEAGEMTIGSGVLLLALHHPVHVAETVASLDILANGRFVFGIGQGYRGLEFEAFGLPGISSRGLRAERFEANLNLIKRLWSEESVSYADEWCRLDAVRMNLRPVQRPHPPIWIAANNDAAVRRAARLGDGWLANTDAPREVVERQLALYRQERRRCNRSPHAEIATVKEIFCARDRPTALERAGPYLASKYREYAAAGQVHAVDASPGHGSFDRALASTLARRCVLGSPAECLEQLKTCWRHGHVDHLLLRTHWAGMPAASTRDSMRMISDELLPELRRLDTRTLDSCSRLASGPAR